EDPFSTTLGPLLITSIHKMWGVPGWLLLGGVFLVAGLAMGPAVRWAEAPRRGAGNCATSHNGPAPEDLAADTPEEPTPITL
ncbi:hypothetical protein ACFWY6_14015, partial [Streptomyces sp. NPDC059037]